MLRMVKMSLKGEVGSHALNSHENCIVDHGKIMELCFRIFVETLTYIICLFQVCHHGLYGGLPTLLVSALGDFDCKFP